VTTTPLGESGGPASGRIAALCVTFGAPLFGDEAARRFLSVERQFAASMFHFVGEKDPVPSLLSLAHSVSAAKRQLEDKVRCDHSCFRDMLFFKFDLKCMAATWPGLLCPPEFLLTILSVFAVWRTDEQKSGELCLVQKKN
jgi:hypothetical protein